MEKNLAVLVGVYVCKKRLIGDEPPTTEEDVCIYVQPLDLPVVSSIYSKTQKLHSDKIHGPALATMSISTGGRVLITSLLYK